MAVQGVGHGVKTQRVPKRAVFTCEPGLHPDKSAGSLRRSRSAMAPGDQLLQRQLTAPAVGPMKVESVKQTDLALRPVCESRLKQ